MKKFLYVFFIILFAGAGTLMAQNLVLDFESNNIGDALPTIGWGAADIEAQVADNPVTPGNKVLRNTIHNYNAAPVLLYVIPAGKMLADYTSFTFKGYFAQGDVGYKNIVVEAYQTMPTGQAYNNASNAIGSWNRAQMGSTAWEDITIDITNTMTFTDTIYIAFGINCAGTGDVGGAGSTTIWYADDITLVAAQPQQLITVDAEKDDFYNTLTGPDDGYLQLKYFCGNDNGTPYNNADLSAKIWTAWDTTWFYLYTEVKDNVVANNGTTSYNNDGLELKIDPQATDSTQATSFAPNLTALGGPNTDSLSGVTNTDPTAAQWARRLTSDGYALELAIKWSAITNAGEYITPAVDTVFGMAINIHDNDGGGARRASVQWAAVMLDAVWNNTKYMGTVKLLGDHKMQFIPRNNMTRHYNPIPFDGTPFYINVDALQDRAYTPLKGPGDGYLQIKSYAGNNNGFPTSDADLSAKVWTAWDDSWFYLYEEVKDNIISNNGSTSYNNDGLELKIDPQPTDSTQGGSSIFAPNLTALGGPNTDSLNIIPDSLKQWARRRISGGYALELAIKWSAITTPGETITPVVDNVFGMAINDHDNDSIPAARRASIMWAAVMLDQVWNTPKYLGTVKFLADNKLDFIPKNNMTGVTNPIPYDGTPVYMIIDAKKDPFYNSLTGPSSGYLQIRSYAYNDNGKPTDDADLSAKVWGAWDASWFYLYTEVKDDIVTNIGSTSYFNDGLELKIDPMPTDSTQGGNSIFAPNLTALSGPHSDSLSNIPDSLKKWARAKISGGYALELAIKWAAITVPGDSGLIVPKVNNVFGMAINVHDNDTLPNARVASIMWAAVMKDAAWNTPKYLGTVKFASGNKLNFIAKNNMTGVTNIIPYDGSDFVGVREEKADNLPIKYDLSQNYPNPFNPATTIKFSIAKNSNVKLVVFDILGRVVTELVNGNYNAGYYSVTLNASYLSSGVYFYRLEAGSYVNVKKLVLLK